MKNRHESHLLLTGEVAHLLGISPDTVRLWARLRRLSPGVRTQDDGSHPRRLERGAPHGRQMGPSPGQSSQRRGSAGADQRAAEMGADDSAGHGPARRTAAAGAEHGGPGHAVGASPRRAVCASLERLRRAEPVPDGSGVGVRGCIPARPRQPQGFDRFRCQAPA